MGNLLTMQAILVLEGYVSYALTLNRIVYNKPEVTIIWGQPQAWRVKVQSISAGMDDSYWSDGSQKPMPAVSTQVNTDQVN